VKKSALMRVPQTLECDCGWAAARDCTVDFGPFPLNLPKAFPEQ